MLHFSLVIQSLHHLVRMCSCCACVAVSVRCSELRLPSGFIDLAVCCTFPRVRVVAHRVCPTATLMCCPLGLQCIRQVSRSQMSTFPPFYTMKSLVHGVSTLSAHLRIKSMGRSSCPMQPTWIWSQALPTAKATPGYGVYHSYHGVSVYICKV